MKETATVMNRRATFALFLTVMLGVYFGTHLYLGLRLLDALRIEGSPALWWVGGLALLMAFLFPASRIIARTSLRRLGRALDWVASSWLGVALYLILFSALAQVAGLVLRWTGLWSAVQGLAGVDPGLIGLVAVVLGTILMVIAGLVSASRVTRVTDLTVPVRDLPADLEGFTLVQLSDIHLGAIVGRRRLERIVGRVNDLAADLIVITGDLIDEDAAGLQELIEPLRRLEARHGVMAVTGNHEFYAGVSAASDLMDAASIRLLRNEATRLPGGLMIYGVDDPQGAVMGRGRVALTDVIGPEAREAPSVLLYHQPVGFDVAASLGVDLVLSGHTHGGQLWPLSLFTRIFYPRWTGHHVLGDSHLYVSAGTGTWGPPMRVGAPPEIARIRLTAAP
jgi:predicted MPP superfamily phosphohydrolase